MKIALLNPNSTASMTDKVRVVAEQYAAVGTEIIVANPSDTPVSIEGHYDEAMSLPGLLTEVQKADAAGADGIVIACFDDPGLPACREISPAPVVGLCESAMQFATVLATSFSVVTTLPRSVPIIEECARRYGMEHRCRKVRAANIPVLDLEHDAAAAVEKIKAEINRAIAEDRCEAVILGCAGMADLTRMLTKECGIPVIDGVVCALKLCEAIVGAGLKTSKINGYATPRKK
ncbi:MAG: aspartate/glutamate racemase family protein [Proteobacteria bacterium]|nr:aspartate/glutamate racemase family protein [Pseudomonadota bacterium]